MMAETGILHGLCMGSVWSMCTLCTDCVWIMLDYAWVMYGLWWYGLCMEYVYGLCMDCVWIMHAVCMYGVCTDYGWPWTMYGLCVLNRLIVLLAKTVSV